MRIDLDWTADSRDPLFLRAPIAPALPVARDDVGAVLKGLDALGYYDAEAGGIPPRSPSVVHDAIERFQADHGLARDGVMQPDGPTLRTLNRIFEARREEKFREEQDAAAAARTAAGRPSPIALTGQNNAVVGPHPAADDVNFNDGNASSLYAQLRQQERRIPPAQRQPQRRGGLAPRPAPQRQAPERPAPARPPAPAPRPSAPAQRQPWRDWDQVPDRRAEGEEDYWNALTQDVTLGPRAREAMDVTSYWEGGSIVDRDSGAVGGVLPGTLNGVRGPLELIVRAPADMTPAQRAAVMRFYLNRELAFAARSRGLDGTQLIEEIANRPYAGAREISVLIADSLVRWGGPATSQDIRDGINRVVRQLGSRVPQGVRPLPENRRAFGPQTLSTLYALMDAGHAEELRSAIVAGYGIRAERQQQALRRHGALPQNRESGDMPRFRFLRDLNLPPIRNRAQR